MGKLLLLFLLCLPSWGAWGYYILHEPDAGQVSSGPHTNFVVYIDTTHNDLRVTGSGGLVTDAQGDDIAPFSDATCTTMLEHDREAYDGTTGRWRGHVKIGSLASTTDVYLCFENSAQTTYLGSATNTWTAYVARYGFGDGTTLSMSDSTGTYNLTNSGGTAATGQIYGAVAYVAASSQYSYINSAILSTTPLTITAWAKTTVSPGTMPIATIQTSGSNNNMHRLLLYLGKVHVQTQTTDPAFAAGLVGASVDYSTSNWFHAAGVFANGSSRKAYYNGANSGTDTTTAVPIGLNRTWTRTEATDQYMDGSIDELRFANAARSDGWIATEYNSGIPGTFWVVGSPVSLSGGAARRRVIVVQ